MRRSKPLQRKTPLKSSGKGLKKSPLKKVSQRQAKRLASYSVTKAIYLAAHPNCERCGAPSGHLHHKRKRGIYLDDPRYYSALCAMYHEWVHENGKIARKEGWIID